MRVLLLFLKFETGVERTRKNRILKKYTRIKQIRKARLGVFGFLGENLRGKGSLHRVTSLQWKKYLFSWGWGKSRCG